MTKIVTLSSLKRNKGGEGQTCKKELQTPPTSLFTHTANFKLGGGRVFIKMIVSSSVLCSSASDSDINFSNPFPSFTMGMDFFYIFLTFPKSAL